MSNPSEERPARQRQRERRRPAKAGALPTADPLPGHDGTLCGLPDGKDGPLCPGCRAERELADPAGTKAEATTDETAPPEEWPEDQRGDAWEDPRRAELNGHARPAELNGKAHHQAGAAGGRGPAPYAPRLYSSAEFFKSDFRREFFVRNVLVKDQPAVLGGGKKNLKSGIVIDLAISIDTATPFLGCDRFTVPRRANVLLLNGESGEATLQETATRIASARGIRTEDLRILWGSDLPQLANVEHLSDLANILEKNAIEVFILDPSYLCLLAGMGPEGPRASNLFEMGQLYTRFAKSCLSVACTPILVAHAKKDRTKEAPDLDDLAFAGIAEFARQWLLLSRREAYEGDGVHKLWLNIGGSAGHSFLGHAEIHEGVIDEDFQGRKWEATVTPYADAAKELKSNRDQAKLERNQADEQTVITTLDRLVGSGEAATVTKIRNGSGLSRPRTDAALERLRQQRLIEEYLASVAKGNRAKMDAPAYRRPEADRNTV